MDEFAKQVSQMLAECKKFKNGLPLTRGMDFSASLKLYESHLIYQI